MSDGTRDSDGSPATGRDDWEALARYLSGESPPEEERAIRRLLESRPDDATLVAALDRAMNQVAFTPPADLNVEGALRNVKKRMEDADVAPMEPRLARPIVRPVSRWRVAQAGWPAAAAAAVLMVGLLVWRAVGRDGSALVDATVARIHATLVGQTDSVRLIDGSLVVLAPSSRITIPGDYGATRREVTLEGEGYFDVAHDSTRQFTVRSGGATIQDLGTAFTVRSAGSDSVVVAVTAGTVLLRATSAPNDSGVLLRAGDLGALRRDGDAVAVRGVVTSETIAWTRGRLLFRAAPLSEVGDAMRRWYGIELRFADSTLADRRIDIDLTGEPPARALELIALTLGGEVERRGDTAVVRPRSGATAR